MPRSEENIFKEPKLLKKWAINLANACGGQEVSQTGIKLNNHSTHKIDKLVVQFVTDYNFNMQVMNDLREKEEKQEEE
tara:strand:- start:1618 stop:1851 length:234 start_codon:yes stop_codon:yes gene_type:complete